MGGEWEGEGEGCWAVGQMRVRGRVRQAAGPLVLTVEGRDSGIGKQGVAGSAWRLLPRVQKAAKRAAAGPSRTVRGCELGAGTVPVTATWPNGTKRISMPAETACG